VLIVLFFAGGRAESVVVVTRLVELLEAPERAAGRFHQPPVVHVTL
jgi:hypothetical protein